MLSASEDPNDITRAIDSGAMGFIPKSQSSQVMIGALRLVLAGGTAGVLDEAGHTIERLTVREAARLIRTGTASKGMVAKLEACRAALRKGVGDVVIANGRDMRLDALAGARALLPGCTQVVR